MPSPVARQHALAPELLCAALTVPLRGGAGSEKGRGFAKATAVSSEPAPLLAMPAYNDLGANRADSWGELSAETTWPSRGP